MIIEMKKQNDKPLTDEEAILKSFESTTLQKSQKKV